MTTSEPVTMPNPDHPDDELLAALAAGEPDAVRIPALAAHVAGCEQCASVVVDLRTLRTALADLPDVRPTRPLRFLPPVADAPPTGARSGWVKLVRRVSGPVMGVAAVLILVGALGTAMGLGPQATSTAFDREAAGARAAQPMTSPGRDEAGASGQDRDAYALTPGAGGTATPSAAPVFGSLASPSAAASDGLQSSASSAAPEPAGAAPSGRPPFEALLATGIMLLAVTLLARAAVQRREPPGTL